MLPRVGAVISPSPEQASPGATAHPNIPPLHCPATEPSDRSPHLSRQPRCGSIGRNPARLILSEVYDGQNRSRRRKLAHAEAARLRRDAAALPRDRPEDQAPRQGRPATTYAELL